MGPIPRSTWRMSFIPCLENSASRTDCARPALAGPEPPETTALGDVKVSGQSRAEPRWTGSPSIQKGVLHRGADCGARTAEMADWDVSLVTDMSYLFNGKDPSTRTYRGGTSARSRHGLYVF